MQLCKKSCLSKIHTPSPSHHRRQLLARTHRERPLGTPAVFVRGRGMIEYSLCGEGFDLTHIALTTPIEPLGSDTCTWTCRRPPFAASRSMCLFRHFVSLHSVIAIEQLNSGWTVIVAIWLCFHDQGSRWNGEARSLGYCFDPENSD